MKQSERSSILNTGWGGRIQRFYLDRAASRDCDYWHFSRAPAPGAVEDQAKSAGRFVLERRKQMMVGHDPLWRRQ